jgi:acetyl esterase/lipase
MKLLWVCAAAWVLTSSSPSRAEEPAFTRQKDVVYGRKFGAALTMDIFKPRKPTGAAIIWVVSGGWISNPEAISPVFVQEFVNRGFTVFAVCHGCQPKFAIPEIIDDMHRAVRYIRHHAKEFHIDPDRIGVTGASAGGHLSLILGTDGKEADPKIKDPVDRESSKVQAVACFFPPTDFLNFGTKGYELNVKTAQPKFRASFQYAELDSQTRTFTPITDDAKLREVGRRVSPITHVKSTSAPTLIIHGDKDDLVPLQQAEIFVAKLKECAVPCELIVKTGAGHGWPTLLADLKTFADWFEKHLPPKNASR